MNNRRENNTPRKNINKQLEQREVKEKDESLILLGKFFYSLSGITCAGIVLVILNDFDVNKVEILSWATIAMMLLAILGWLLVKRGNIKK